MSQLLPHAPARARTPMTALVWIALVLALAPAVVVLAGYPLQEAACDQATGCWTSDRERWVSTGFSWVSLGVMSGVFIVSVARIGPWVRVRPRLLKGGSIAALCVLVPIMGLLALASVIVWNTQCSAGSILCVGGHDTALAIGSVSAVLALVSALLIVGLARAGTRFGVAVSTAILAALGAMAVAAVAGTVATHVLDGIFLSLFY